MYYVTLSVSLDGALGKIAIRTRSAPRPLLQVDNSKRNSLQSLDEKTPLSAADLAGSLASSMPTQSGAKHGAALTRRETLGAIEHVYDVLLKLEQTRRPLAALVAAAQAEAAAEQAGQPVPRVAREAVEEQEKIYKELVEEMWKGLKVMEPLDASSPHPFISLMSVTKGKKLLPRVLRHTTYQQTLVLLTLLIATFDTLDVVRDAAILDMNPNDPAFYATTSIRGAAPLNVAVQKKARKQVEMETELFLNAAIPLVMGVIASSQLRIIAGMMGLLIERNDLIKIAKTKVSSATTKT
jgi:DNA topoisomerase 2-associated protein PAT1